MLPSLSPSLVPSLIRTVVPLIVGYLLSIPLAQQFGVTSEQATQAVTAVLVFVYYLVARILEHYVSPRFGWLLGSATAPTYQNDKTIPGLLVGPAIDPAAPAAGL